MVFRVRDTGLGMSPEQVNYLFQPFEQADGSITRRFGGTGLGLAITKRLVELMAGEIEVESTLNVGSVFTVKLPLTPVSIPLTSNIIINPAIAAHDDNLLQGIRVLAAEDNPVNRMVLEDGLTLHGAKLICVENGRDALELVHKHGADNWDIVLTDVHMPVMDGHELARRLREFAPNLPVVGVTAHAMVEERDRCFASGMVAHVAKPIVLDELIGVIRHHARRQVRPEGKGESQPLGQSRGPIAQHAVETASISSVTAPEDTSTSDLAVSSDPDEALTAFIDMAALMAQFQGRRVFIDKILSTFLQSHANTPENLRAAALAGNYDDLVFLAHSFSGVAGALQANDLRLQGKEVELLARQKDQDALKKAVELALIVEKFMQTITSKQTSQ
jgi:CheY-like chemotaxis protein